ncbi:ISNCY family transposase, partial [Paraburkholderia sp. SIMBA_049]
IQTMEAANAWAPAFMAAYNARFAKPPRSTFDAHRPLREDENLDTILTWRVVRKVSDSLTVLNDLMIWLLEDTP